MARTCRLQCFGVDRSIGGLLLVLVLALAVPAAADNWTQFRGDNASGVTQSSASLPAEFSDKENVRWSAKLGEGIGSPVVSNGRVIATSMSGPQTFKIFCLDAASGKPIWEKEFETGTLPAIQPPNTQASSTPAVDATKTSYAYFSTLGIVALRASDGKEQWRTRPSSSHFI